MTTPIDVEKVASELIGTDKDLNDVLMKLYGITSLDLNLLQAVELDGKAIQCARCNHWDEALMFDADDVCKACRSK